MQECVSKNADDTRHNKKEENIESVLVAQGRCTNKKDEERKKKQKGGEGSTEERQEGFDAYVTTENKGKIEERQEEGSLW